MFFEPMLIKTYAGAAEMTAELKKRLTDSDRSQRIANEYFSSKLDSFTEKMKERGITVNVCHGFAPFYPDTHSGEAPVGFCDVNDNIKSCDFNSAFAIIMTRTEIYVFRLSDYVLPWAIDTLSEYLSEKTTELGEEEYLVIFDCPDRSLRGYRFYLPARAHFDEFFKMVDLLAELRMNTVVFEIGGAMRYDRHPEINDAWEKFALEMHSHSGRAHEVQFGYDWEKDSIHVDNAEGDILTKDEIRTLIAYCNSRGINVIPEVPCLSHSDYICLAHPELAERAEDPYPDTYCPSNPKSYEIVFDILDEVMEVFDSPVIHIGHDEYYTSGICEKCRTQKPHELYAKDITKIHDYLAAHGRKTMMWGEKLLAAHYPDGTPIGGSGTPRKTDENGNVIEWRIPPLYECRHLIPKDVLMLHWYWIFDEENDLVYHENGYQAFFGNFSAFSCENYRKRVNAGINGGFVSNWGAFAPEYMQRNMQYISLIFTSIAFWSHTYDTTMREEYYRKSLDKSHELWKSSLCDPIEVRCTTNAYIPHQYYYDGIFVVDDNCTLGSFVLTYEDGTTESVKVKYGFNIGNDGSYESFKADILTDNYTELSHAAVPSAISPDGRIWYDSAFENPRPGMRPAGIDFIKNDIGIGEFEVWFDNSEL